MDLSLHSFILVVGLVVMAFILWDGIKKVKQSRANKLRIKLDDQLENLPSDADGFGSEFPNGGARSLDGSDGLDFNGEKFEELEFDENLVTEESLSANQQDEETYVSASLINDVENELQQMDAMDGESSVIHDAETVSETYVADEIIESEFDEKTAVATPEAISESQNDDDSTAPVELSDVINDEVASTKDIKDAVQALDEPPMEFMMPASALDKLDNVSIDEPINSISNEPTPDIGNEPLIADKNDTRKEAEAKAEKLKAELNKISAAKKQLAAKKAYEDAVKQKQNEEETSFTAPSVAETEEPSQETSVPMLMEPVELGDTIDPNPPEQKELTLPDQPEEVETPEAELESFSALDDADSSFTEEIDPLMDDVPEEMLAQKEQVGESLKDRPAPQEVLVINVLKGAEDPLKGADLNHIFNVCDLRHGEMNIFHRFEQANAKGKIQFSVANAVEPGTFDMATIDSMTTTGISFFMSLPGPEHPMDAFEAMVEVAHVFARNFNAELHDESHSDLTPQTIEHSRNRIREFCRKQKMSAAPA